MATEGEQGLLLSCKNVDEEAFEKLRISDISLDPVVLIYYKVLYWIGYRATTDDLKYFLDRPAIGFFSKPSLYQLARFCTFILLPLCFALFLGLIWPGLFNQSPPSSWSISRLTANIIGCMHQTSWENRTRLVIFFRFGIVILTVLLLVLSYIALVHYLHDTIFEKAQSLVPLETLRKDIIAGFVISVIGSFLMVAWYSIEWLFLGILPISQFPISYLLYFIQVVCIYPFLFATILGLCTVHLCFRYLYLSMEYYRDNILPAWNGEDIEQYLIQRHYFMMKLQFDSSIKWKGVLTLCIFFSFVLTLWNIASFFLTGEGWSAIFVLLLVVILHILRLMGTISRTNETVAQEASSMRGLLSFNNHHEYIEKWDRFLVYLNYIPQYWRFWILVKMGTIASIIFGIISFVVGGIPFMIQCYKTHS